MKTWTIEIELTVSNNWIEDGFDASERKEQIAEMIQGLLPYAYEHEVQTTVTIKQHVTNKRHITEYEKRYGVQEETSHV